MRRFADARAELEALALEAPNDPAVLNALGAAHYEAGEWDAARRALERAVALQPDHPLAHATLGELALRREDYPAAARHFGAALRAERPDLVNVQRWIKALWAATTATTPR